MPENLAEPVNSRVRRLRALMASSWAAVFLVAALDFRKDGWLVNARVRHSSIDSPESSGS